MFDWDDLRFFLALAKHGTQKAAAVSLNVDQATVGRRVRELEERLGTKLFDKTSENYIVTSAGAKIQKISSEVEELCHSVDRKIAGSDGELSGLIRVAMPGALANHWLIPSLKPFLEKYPEIRFEFLTGAEVVNLWKREADIALRLVRPQQKELFSRRVGEIRLGLYGSISFFQTHGYPKKTSDVLTLPFAGLFDSATSASEKRLLQRIGHFQNKIFLSAAWSSVFSSVETGLSLGILPDFLAEKSPRLKRVELVPLESAPLWLVMHPDVKGTGRLKTFANFLIHSRL